MRNDLKNDLFFLSAKVFYEVVTSLSRIFFELSKHLPSLFSDKYKYSTYELGCKCGNLVRCLRVWRSSSSRSVCLHFISPKEHASVGMD